MDPALLAAVMQDPELLSLISKPEVMSKFQAIMADPSTMSQYASDPDVQLLMQKLQSSGLASRATTTQTPIQPPSPQGGVVTINGSQHYHGIVNGSRNNLVVADFTATWCGPCKQIAPTVESLARRHASNSVVMKVDADSNRELVSSLGVKGFPTFIFYRGGKELERFSGADSSKLENTFYQHLDVPEEKEAASPYRSFPLQDSEMTKFDDVDWGLIEEKSDEFNNTVEESAMLSSEEMDSLKSLCAVLKDRTGFLKTDISSDKFQSLEKCLNWPIECIAPALNVFRILVFHPSVSKSHFNICEKLVEIVKRSDAPVVQLLVLQTVINMTTRYELVINLLQRLDEILDTLDVCAEAKSKKLRQTYANLLINLAILCRQDLKAARLLYPEAKIRLLSSISQLLSVETDKGVAYRAVVTLGSLIYRDEETKAIAGAMELESVAVALQSRPKIAKDTETINTINEVRACFASSTN